MSLKQLLIIFCSTSVINAQHSCSDFIDYYRNYAVITLTVPSISESAKEKFRIGKESGEVLVKV